MEKLTIKKQLFFLRWNVFDTLTIVLSIYTILCVQSLNMLVSSGQTVENPYVQFFLQINHRYGLQLTSFI